MDKIIKILKKIKLRNLIILIILLSFNTYAWFVYATRVDAGLTAHISAWEVEFTAKEGGVDSTMTIDVERIFPGMDVFEKEIQVINKGEVDIQISYEIKSLKIMDEYYEVGVSGVTSQDLENRMKNNYPFKINVVQDDSGLENGTGNGKFNITVEWPFESGNDAVDTRWGNKAYEYYALNPGEKCIELKLVLSATQSLD